MPRAVFLFLSLSVSLLLSAQQAWSADGRSDYDLDDDGLIEINDWSDLDEVRNNLDGASLYGSSAGCPADGCIGFELTTDLDFDTNGDGILDGKDTYWNEGEGWLPIGSNGANDFTGVFHGGGHLIRNLMVSRPYTDLQGLFGFIRGASVKELGLTGNLTKIEGNGSTGTLAGYADSSQITAVFASSNVTGTGDDIGGLVGNASDSEITASYFTGTVSGGEFVGGLVGARAESITASISTAYVTADRFSGGLIGRWGTVSASYWAVDVSGQTDAHYSGAEATLAELQCPTNTDNTTCADAILYEGWSNYTGAGGNAYWDFGSDTELPGLRLQGSVYRDGDGDGAHEADDAFPEHFAASVDSDGDGAPDAWRGGCEVDCQSASGLVLDQFPETAAAAVDADLDGLPDQWNEGCDSACQTASGLALDSLPNDSDNDGISNAEDYDDNNDGIVDADADSDGLIEISSLAELDAIRHSLAGAGLRLVADGELNISGCPHIPHNGVLQQRCSGYELTADLDFDTNGDGVLDSNDSYWNEGQGWQPIGDSLANPFTAVFHGNGHLIRNVMSARPTTDYQSLFGCLEDATVMDLGLNGPLMRIEGNRYVGGLAGGVRRSQISAVFVSGFIQGNTITSGGLVGYAVESEISTSYVTGSVRGVDVVGGLVGVNDDSDINASVSTAWVFGSSRSGGLIGYEEGRLGVVSASYWAEDASGQTSSKGGIGATLDELRCPTGADNTTCADTTLFDGWSNRIDGSGNTYWDFGTDTELPGLVLSGTVYRDGDGDGAADADDVYPAEFAGSVDSDVDGAIDSWTPGCDANCRADSGLTLDHFPDTAAAIVDADWDGLPDHWNEGCDSGCQSASGLTLDSALNDTDNDGIVNSIDDDDNSDGIVDADSDSDGLIEVSTLAELNAIRNSLSGGGLRLEAEGELNSSGCPYIVYDGVLQQRCRGYELTADLDFDTNGDGILDSNDTYWNDGEGWKPIGRDYENVFSGVFHGNGHVIRNLMITRPDTNFQGLFGHISNAIIKELGLSGPLMAVTGRYNVGGLAGVARYSQISASYVSGSVTGTDAAIGGLIGYAPYSEISASFTTGAVTGDNDVGGLVGAAFYGQITNSISTAFVSARHSSGGLAGDVYETAVNTSYWAEDASGTTSSDGGGTGFSLAELQCPTAADNTVCTDTTLFEGWSDSVDADGNTYWDFGSNSELPGLLLNGTVYRDGDGDGAADADDPYPAEFAGGFDSDGDGAIDFWTLGCDADCRAASGLILDQFPDTAAASVDADWDGLPDEWNDGCDSACQSASGLTLDDDNDNDGVANEVDAFPTHAAAAVDADNDGLPDAWLDSCDSACQSGSGLTLDASLNDTDNDGVVNDEDAFVDNAAASVDTDGDGFPDAWLDSCDSACQSASGLTLDDDNDDDGVANEADAFPIHAAAAVDADNDGHPDAWLDTCDSACQSASGLTLDTSLNDTDNDGVVNDEDAFVDNAAASVDADNDGLPDAWLDSCDSACQSASGLTLDTSLNDTDNDGVVNDEDAFVDNAAASVDTDGDGLPDAWLDSCDSACQSASGLALDDDNDNDGVANEADAFPIHAAASVDADDDGFPDAWLDTCDSACQSASSLTLDTSLNDTDNDGVVNDEDAFVGNAAASVDTDNDGLPDAWLDSCDSACQSASGLTLDDDNDDDGVANEADAFPIHAAASVDADNDGLPDVWLDSCDSACQSASGLTLDASLNDTDNDGVVNDEDAFVDNAAASVDTDGDGLPDAWLDSCDSACQSASGLALDDDNDNDGVANEADAFPIHAAASVDADNDGLPDAWLDSCDSACQSASGLTLDTSLNDTDNDGVVNDEDAFVDNAAASVDTDGDGLPDAWLDTCDSTCQSESGLTLDTSLNDTDNDGVVNSEDAYPTDPDRAEDEDAPEMASVPESISVAATGETTLVTLDVVQAQAHDNFDDQLDYQVELDGEVLVRNAEQQVSLPSGALTLDWVAVDDAGNRSEPMAQTVKVYPLVRFSLSESVTGEQNLAEVAVSLSGPSPEYPVAVLVDWIEADSDANAADLVTEGQNGVDLANLGLIIESADALENAVLEIPVAADDEVEPDEYFTLELNSAWAGEDEPFAMPIDEDHQRHRMTFTDTNIAPTAEVSAVQAGEPGSVFITDAGEVTVTAEVTDVNGGDSHSYQWYTDELPVTPGDQASFTFDPQVMSQGDYSIRVVVTDDGNPMLSSDEVTFEFTLEEAEVPDDGGNDEGGADDGDSDDGDSDGGQDSGGGQNPPSTGGGSSGGSSGGSINLWLLCLLTLAGLWRRRLIR
ncbi:GlyGly-CTERM sorting domain-containing protein [Microbulbifer celer]|uniref:GlyGly-CTERM sorting domain-containing protein n=2 Tax=Microbulbifer TaxID=48073 RepID=A0ABW3UAB6_9GAMM|nr:GlyGly-CTERM sorting domain-containing protein [Microbulbifer celer]UFN57033.1 GlyGly-CTERM sorting domain-containing protein [Microbulbifer celer]